MAGGIALTLGGLYAYDSLVTDYVRSTDRLGTKHYAVIGDQRTSLALERYATDSDQRILEKAGIQDGDIETMWVAETVRSARKLLFFSATGVWFALNFSVGSFARSTFKR